MKQTTEKTEVTKVPPLQATAALKTHETSKTEEAHQPKLTKTNLLDRFLEASCDCV